MVQSTSADVRSCFNEVRPSRQEHTFTAGARQAIDSRTYTAEGANEIYLPIWLRVVANTGPFGANELDKIATYGQHKENKQILRNFVRVRLTYVLTNAFGEGSSLNIKKLMRWCLWYV